jgi:hypothetical protein
MSIIEVNEEESKGVSAKRRKRTTNLGITFESGMADGWAYGVPLLFRESLDIFQLRYVDKELTKTLRLAKGKRDEFGQLRTVFVRLWTRGVPPALTFREGDIFYNPPNVRNMRWSAALRELTHSIQIIAAQPDADDGTGGGWVEFEERRYRDGQIESHGVRRVAQCEFETILRLG